MRISNVHIILIMLGVQLLQSCINAYVLLTANLDHLKAVSDRLQKSPINSKLQAALEQLTNRKLMSQRSQKRKPENQSRFRSHNQRRRLYHRDQINEDFQPNRDLNIGQYFRRKAYLSKQHDKTIHPVVRVQEQTAKKTCYTPRSNADRNRALISGEQLRSKESLEDIKGIMDLKNILRKKPNVSSDYEDILKYVHIAEDHHKAIREIRGSSD